MPAATGVHALESPVRGSSIDSVRCHEQESDAVEITRTDDIEQIDEAYADMHQGLNVRWVVSVGERHR